MRQKAVADAPLSEVDPVRHASVEDSLPQTRSHRRLRQAEPVVCDKKRRGQAAEEGGARAKGKCQDPNVAFLNKEGRELPEFNCFCLFRHLLLKLTKQVRGGFVCPSQSVAAY